MNLTATKLNELNQICNRLTVFKDFKALLDAPDQPPSLNVANRDLRTLADAYDNHQRDIQSPLRANRIYILKHFKI